jgi:hypothetical protein
MDSPKIEFNNLSCALPKSRVTQLRPSDQFDDFLTDDLFESITSTPVGRLLALISTLPEVRTEKVHEVRDRLSNGNYDIKHNLDSALDRVLEELLLEE